MVPRKGFELSTPDPSLDVYLFDIFNELLLFYFFLVIRDDFYWFPMGSFLLTKRFSLGTMEIYDAYSN
jgi:hypothetical protein